MKKLLGILIVFAMVLAFAACGNDNTNEESSQEVSETVISTTEEPSEETESEEQQEVEELAFGYAEGSTSCTIKGIGTYKSLDVVVPETYKDVPVVAIYDRAFYESSITSIQLPASVTTISLHAFVKCEGLKSVNLENVVTFKPRAFCACSSLTEVDLSSAELIDKEAFSSCTGLTSVVLSEDLKEVGMMAFAECTSLENIRYNGTTEQWNNITFGFGWNNNVPATVIRCADGDVAVK